MEIGGFFEFPKLTKVNNGDSAYEHLIDIKKNFQMVRDGRQAIKSVLLNLKDIENKTCYLPAYLCKSILQPFQELNLDVKLYGHEDILKPKIDGVEDSLILVVDYFGRNTLSNREIKETIGRNNTFILDATHSILDKERFSLKQEDYYIISSLRKIFPIPDGGILYGNGSSFEPLSACFPEGYGKILESMILRSFYLNGDDGEIKYSDDNLDSMLENSNAKTANSPDLKAIKKYYLSLHYEYEQEKFTCYDTIQNIPSISTEILKNISFSDIVKKRNENLKFLYDEIKDKSIFLYDYEDITSPFMLPLRFETEKKRDSVLKSLIKNDIYPPLLWDLEELVPESFVYEHELRKRIMMIPMDQRYSTDDLSGIADLLNNSH